MEDAMRTVVDFCQIKMDKLRNGLLICKELAHRVRGRRDGRQELCGEL